MLKRVLAALLLMAILLAEAGMALADENVTGVQSVDGFTDGLYFVTFKDVLFKRFMRITKVTDSIHNKITAIFNRIGRH